MVPPDGTNETVTVVKKKKVIRSSSPPLLPKRDEGVLLEIMRNISVDIKSLCDAVNQLNAEIEAKDAPDENDQKMMNALLKQMSEMMDQVMAMNQYLIEQQATNYKDVLKWVLWAGGSALAAWGIAKSYGVIP